LITGLSRIRWLSVRARNSSFLYKGKTIDVQRVGRELHVRYILEGGVRRSANRLRITARLVDAESGLHLWAEKYDRALEDIFDLTDEIAAQVVGIVEPSLQRAEIERSRRKRVDSLDAYDLYLRAFSLVAAHMPQQTAEAIPLLEKALTLESATPPPTRSPPGVTSGASRVAALLRRTGTPRSRMRAPRSPAAPMTGRRSRSPALR
jgi:adenylate cyclase